MVATARDPGTLAELADRYQERCLTLALDVTDPQQITEAVAAAEKHFGRIDVLVNNAGFGLIGALEELSEDAIERNLATNLMGPIRLMRAVLPIMRRQRFGRIINMSAIAGIIGEPGFTIYGGGKYALEGVSEALALEVAPLGIHVTLIEPGPFRTGFVSHALDSAPGSIDDYAPTSGEFAKMLKQIDGRQKGDPNLAAQAILTVAESDEPPMRLPLGAYAQKKVREKLDGVRKELDAWSEVGLQTDFGMEKKVAQS